MASQATDVGSRPPRDWFRYLPLLIPLATVLVIIVTVVTWQSPSEAYTEDACDGLRKAEQGLAEGDRPAVADGARSMGALDPAGEDPDANRADLQKLWAAASAFARVLNEWDDGTAAPEAADDRRLIATGVEVCQAYNSPWFAPQRLLRD